MSTSGTRAAGITIAYCADNTYTTPVTIGQLLDVGLPQLVAEKLDITSGDDATDAANLWKRILSGWKEGGQVTADIIYKKANATVLYGLLGVAKYWVITAVDGSTWKFQGFIGNLGGSAPMKDVIKQKLTIEVDGPVTFTAGT